MAKVWMACFKGTFLGDFVTGKLLGHVNTDIGQSSNRKIIAFPGNERKYIRYPSILNSTLSETL